ncbi:ER membrane protein complex subunit 7 [Marchantia polymorpha subsp. ruderalis]
MAIAMGLRHVCKLTVFCAIVLAASAISAPKAASSYVVEGRVKVEGTTTKLPLSKTANIKVVLNGGEQLTFIRPDGYFAFQGVTAGTHLLEVVAMGYYFSPVRVDVSARLHGQVRAIAVETRRTLPDALVLEPLREEFYYERREPFSVVGLLKSPMGLMVGFMLVAVFLLPKLMDSIDPEEMKRVQEEMRNQPAPSFSNLLQGRST